MFTLKFSTMNDVFLEDLNNATADVLLSVSKYIRSHGLSGEVKQSGAIRDNNGNTIGSWEHK